MVYVCYILLAAAAAEASAAVAVQQSPQKTFFFPSLSPPPSCCCVKRYHFGPPVRKTMTAPHPGSHDDVSSYYTARCDFDVSSTRPVLLHRDFFSFFLFSGCIFDRCGTKCQLEQFAPPPTLLPIYAFAHLDNLWSHQRILCFHVGVDYGLMSTTQPTDMTTIWYKLSVFSRFVLCAQRWFNCVCLLGPVFFSSTSKWKILWSKCAIRQESSGLS